MKKFLAIITVMCMVMTTLVVPTVAFAEPSEGGESATKNVDMVINGEGCPFSIEPEDMDSRGSSTDPFNITIQYGQTLGDAGITKIIPPVFGEDDPIEFAGWKICKYDFDKNEYIVVNDWTCISNDDILTTSINHEASEGEQLLILPVIKAKEKYKNVASEFFKDILDQNGEITVKSIKPSRQEDLDIIFDSLLKKVPNEMQFGYQPVVENDFEKLELTLVLFLESDEEEPGPPIEVPVMSKEVVVNYVYDSTIEDRIADFIDSINLEKREFKLADMELINYWYNISLAEDFSDACLLVNYSSEFKEAIGTYNFHMVTRMGDEPYYHSYEAGDATLIYNDTFYGLVPEVSAKGEHLIYVEEGTASKDLADVAKDRIKRYLGEKVYNKSNIKIIQNYDENTGTAITVENVYKGMYDSYASMQYDWLESTKNDRAMYEEMLKEATNENDKEILRQQIEETNDQIEWLEEAIPQMLKEYEAKIQFLKDIDGSLPTFTLEINGLERNIIIVPEGEKEAPALTTKDFATDVVISTESTEVPLDSLIEATPQEKCNDVLINDYDVDANDQITYDLKVNSKTLARAVSNSTNGYITKLENGLFEVVVPIKDKNWEGKTIVAYYVDKQGNVETHKVTVKDGKATFTTDHFSEYTLAPVSDDNSSVTPETNSGTTITPDKAVDTGDNFNVIPFIAVMVIALAGVAAAFFRRKTAK